MKSSPSPQPEAGHGRECPRCAEVSASDSAFCTHCGAGFASVRACPGCAAEHETKGRYCPDCGTEYEVERRSKATDRRKETTDRRKESTDRRKTRQDDPGSQPEAGRANSAPEKVNGFRRSDRDSVAKDPLKVKRF